MTPAQFCKRQIEYWDGEVETAAIMGDYDAWRFAVRERDNYRAMLTRYEPQTPDKE